MKTTITSVALLAILITTPFTIQAADDISPVTSTSEQIQARLVIIQQQINRVQHLLGASVMTTNANFVISVDDTVLVNKPTFGMTKESAQAQCEVEAYNTDNMWQLVTCTFGTDVLYRDVFIAG